MYSYEDHTDRRPTRQKILVVQRMMITIDNAHGAELALWAAERSQRDRSKLVASQPDMPRSITSVADREAQLTLAGAYVEPLKTPVQRC
jgi:hypothetical protein